MTITRSDVQAWLDRYVAAWETFDEAAIGDLFSEDAEYRFYPHKEPVRGRDAIVRSWLAPGGDPGARDAPGTYIGRYETWAVDGDRAVAVGTSEYFTDSAQATLVERYHNAFLLRFDGDGRCREVVEYYVKPN